MTLRYGLIGCGMMGREHIRNVALVEGVEFACVYDPVAELAEAAGALAGGARVAQTLDGVIEDGRLDAVVIASPNFVHVDQVEAIARKRALPILCEKPLFTDVSDAARIEALQARFQAPIWVAMEYRYMPPVAGFLSQAREVTGGIKMMTLREHRRPFLEKVGDWNRFNRNTGGTLVEKCCHFFDLMRLTLGAEPVRVMASAGQMVNHFDEIYDGERADIWDGGYAVFDFANGARAMLELCMFADGTIWNEEIMAVGAAGKIECRVPGPQRFWPEALGPSPEPEVTVYPRAPKGPVTEVLALDPALIAAGDHHGSTFFQHVRFADMVRAGGAAEVTLEDGRRAVLMGLAAQMSAEEGRAVSFGSDGAFG